MKLLSFRIPNLSVFGFAETRPIMISARRLSLQLTPLLDLLLIVICAQYLDMEQRNIVAGQQQAEQTARQNFERQQLQNELDFTRQVLSETRKIQSQAEKELAERAKQQQTERDQLAEAQQELTTRLSDISSQRDRILSALQQIYATSSEEISQLLNQLAKSVNAQQPVTSGQVDQLVEQLVEQLASSEPRDLATFLLAYEEIRKRCDIWEIHINAQGLISLFDGSRRHSFRATSADDFQRQLFELYRALPQTKGLVIMLVSYGEVRADVRQYVLLSLPAVTERMRNDSGGRTRFEYAVIGYLPERTEQTLPAPAASE